jgi:5-methylcytosine-specific restriction endonuclease McrA
MRTLERGSRLAKDGKRTMLIRCPNMACQADVVVNLNTDRAHCSYCGNDWPWGKTALLRGTRRA